jgi:D-alanyl-D-alanine carboxypeptidase
MAAERRRQKEILRRRAMRRYYAFLALLGALALAPWWGCSS